MGVETHSLPGLFGGVSQLPPALRHPTQCTAQVNALSTVEDGLYKRPGTTVTYLNLTGVPSGAAVGHVVDRGDSGRHQLVLHNGGLALFDLATGVKQTIATPHGLAYLGSTDPVRDFRAITVADYTFIVNRTVTPAMTAAASAANPTGTLYVHVRGAVQKITYRISVDGYSASYTTADTATHASVLEGLRLAVLAAVPSSTAVVLADTNVLAITRGGAPVSGIVWDSWSNDTLRLLNDGVAKFSDLPPAFTTGYTVQVKGGEDIVAPPYYVRWSGKAWVETTAPGGTLTTIDPATMPHVLKPLAGGGWSFERATWDDRKVGDDTTAPKPSFIGSPIRNVFFHRNRLGFLAGDSLVMSRSGGYFNFWPSSASQVLANDPIDLAATSEDAVTLEAATAYADNLLVFASPRRQFILMAGEALTPETARLDPATGYEADPRATPVVLGNRAMFITGSGSFSRASLFRPSTDRVGHEAEEVTSHCPRLIPAGVFRIASSTSTKAVALLVPGSASFWVLQYELGDQGALTQKAWSEQSLGVPAGAKILGAYWVSRALHLLVWSSSTADPAGRYAIHRLDLDPAAKDPGVAYQLSLDGRVTCTATGAKAAWAPGLHPAGALTWLLCKPGLGPQVLTVQSTGLDSANVRTTATFAEDITGGTVIAGLPFQMTYTFTEPVIRDSRDVPIQDATVKLVKYLIRYTDTGWFQVSVTPLLRATYTYQMDGRIIGRPNQGATMDGLSSGDFTVPVHSRVQDVVTTVSSASFQPVRLPYAEWVGDITYKSARR